MQCKTLSHINENGRKTYKYKETFETLADAIFQCKVMNAKPKFINKLVSYKCTMCHKYHIGRNGKKLTAEYKAKLNKELDILFPKTKGYRENERNKHYKRNNPTGNTVDNRFSGSVFKVIGKIDLNKVPKD